MVHVGSVTIPAFTLFVAKGTECADWLRSKVTCPHLEQEVRSASSKTHSLRVGPLGISRGKWRDSLQKEGKMKAGELKKKKNKGSLCSAHT